MKQKYQRECIIDTYSCDKNKIAKVSGILQHMQEAGRQQMEIQKPSYEDLLSEGKALMLSRLDLLIHEIVPFDEPLTVASWPCENVKATFLRCYTISKGEKVIAEVSSQWALVDIETRRILKADEADFSNYYMGEYKELFDTKFRIPRDAEFKKVGEYHVGYTDLDYNGHMNNTYYMDMLCNAIPELGQETHRVKAVRVHYSKEAPLGEVLAINRFSPEAGVYIFKTIKQNGETNIEARVELAEL